MINKYIIVDLKTLDFMKDESNNVKIYNTEKEARETCGMYEFENVWVCKLTYNYIDEQSNIPPVIVLCDSCNNYNKWSHACQVKCKFKEENKTQSEFIKILGGNLHECDFYIHRQFINVAVVSKNILDFIRFIESLNHTDIKRVSPYTYTVDNTQYHCVSNKYHCVGMSLPGIIVAETEFAHKNPKYTEIMEYLTPHITPK